MTVKDQMNSPEGRFRLAQQLSQQSQRNTGKIPQRNVIEVPLPEDDKPIMDVEASNFDETFEKMVADPKKVVQARQAAVQSSKIIDEEKKTKLEVLLGLKRKIKDVTVDEIPFRIQSLKTRENKEILAKVGEKTLTSSALVIMEMRTQTLARAVTHIDGKPIAYFMQSDDYAAEFDEMPDSIIEGLYDEYSKLNKPEPLQEDEVKSDLKK